MRSFLRLQTNMISEIRQKVASLNLRTVLDQFYSVAHRKPIDFLALITTQFETFRWQLGWQIRSVFVSDWC